MALCRLRTRIGISQREDGVLERCWTIRRYLRSNDFGWRYGLDFRKLEQEGRLSVRRVPIKQLRVFNLRLCACLSNRASLHYVVGSIVLLFSNFFLGWNI